MKKINRLNLSCFFFIAVFFLIAIGYASAEDAIFVDEDGNVGIGTSNPIQKFHIENGNIAFTYPSNPENERILLFSKTGIGSSTGYKFSWRNDDLSPRLNGIELDRNGNVLFNGGNVGIGTINPTSKLTVNGEIKAKSRLDFTTTAYIESGGRMHLYGPERLYLLNKSGVIIGKEWGGSGNLMVQGAASVGSKLSVGGNLAYKAGSHSVQMTNTPGYLEYVIDGKAYGVSIWASSRRFKENIETLDISSDTIFSLTPVSFNWIEERGGKKDFGLIAEDVAEIIPELALYDEDGKPFSVRYELLSVLLLQEMQKQQEINTDLMDRVSNLEIENGQLKDRLSKIEAALESMGHKNGKNDRNGKD